MRSRRETENYAKMRKQVSSTPYFSGIEVKLCQSISFLSRILINSMSAVRKLS